ncbi:MAG TPA: hypothetical protein VNN25_01295 [Thermoanaerobaculia bacterium]|nr:hypothetical protein [Thermoanaerobaculia bacterium]
MRQAFSIDQRRGNARAIVTTRRAAVLVALVALGACNRVAPSAASASRVASTSVVENNDSSAPAFEDKVPDIEACALLDRVDVIRIFGPLRDEAKLDRGLRGERDCRWHNEEGQWLKASLYGASRWELEKAIVSEMHPRAIANAGDEAFSVKQGTDSVVHVRKGGAVIEVSCSCGIEKSESLARIAAARL